jgi:pimeloyl-ACP methyl ester carboxylesterase
MTKVNLLDMSLEIQWLTPQVASANPGPHPTLVFLHEGLGSVALWHARQPWWTQQLCEVMGWPGLVYSRRGYGQSSSIPDVRGANRHGPDYMHHEAWEVLPHLLAALGIERPVLVGHSDGGSIALIHAARHPVTACVVMAPHVRVEPICIEAITQARHAFEHGNLRERLARFHSDVDTAFWQWCDVWLSEPFSHFDIRPLCHDITAPVLALQGREDAYGTLAQIEDIEPKNHIERVVLEQCGHSPHRDQPALALTRVAQFLRQL